MASRTLQTLDALFGETISDNTIPSAVAIATTARETFYHGAYGKMDVSRDDPINPNAIFRIASMTKAVTCVCAMMLVEEGALSLDDPAARFLPELDDLQVFESFDPASRTLRTRPATVGITIRHLMTHTCGLGYAFCDQVLADLAQSKIDQDILRHEPGEQWTYGTGIDVLGRIIESITGESLDTCFNRRLFEPLDMSDTYFSVPESKRSRVPTVYRRSEDRAVELSYDPTSKPAGGGGLHSTAQDYICFLRMLLNRGEVPGQRIISPESIDRMVTNQIGDVPVRAMPATSPLAGGWVPLDGTEKFGLGFLLAGTSRPVLRSRGSYSWAGIFNTFFWVDPEKDLAAVLLTQMLPFCDPHLIDLYDRFEQTLYASI